MDELGLTDPSLAKKAGVDVKTIKRWLRSMQPGYNYGTLEKVARALEREPAALLTSIALEPATTLVPRPRSSPSTCELVKPRELLEQITAQQLVEKLLEVDQALRPGAKQDDCGDPDHYERKWSHHADFGGVLWNPASKSVGGYWSASPLDISDDDDSLYQRIKTGRFHDRDLRFGQLTSTDSGGNFALYISFFGVLEPYNSIRKMLFESFAVFLEEQSKNSVCFSELLARPQTDHEVLNLRGLDMRPLQRQGSAKGGSALFATYHVPLRSLVKRPLFKGCKHLHENCCAARSPF
jgi:transcriptional regulator with XRE-family HTH domain